MAEYKGKKIFEGDISIGNQPRKDYLDSIYKYIESKYRESFAKRNEFAKDITVMQEEYRKLYLDMIGQPISPYPVGVPNVKKKYIGSDDFCDIYSLQTETMPGFWFYGILMIPFNIKKAPLVIAQHGGGGVPELCSDFLGENNYNFFTKRALERGMIVFAPQILVWNFSGKTGDKKLDTGLLYERKVLDNKLKHLGLSLTGLEVFCIRRVIDYLADAEYTDKERIGMMGLSYGGYFSLHTAAADKRIKSIYAAGFFNDRTKIAFDDWTYKNSANLFCDAEIAALCAPRRLCIDVGINDPVFDCKYSEEEGVRAKNYYKKFDAESNFSYNLWNGGHRFDESERSFDFFFDGI